MRAFGLIEVVLRTAPCLKRLLLGHSHCSRRQILPCMPQVSRLATATALRRLVHLQGNQMLCSCIEFLEAAAPFRTEDAFTFAELHVRC